MSERSRIPRLPVAAAAVALTLLAATGATALSGGFSTGSPAVDRLIESYEPPPSEPGDPAPPRPDLKPRAGMGSPAVHFDYGDGRRRGVGAAYVTEGGSYCFALAEVRKTDRQPRGGFGCMGARGVRTGLRKAPAVFSGGMYGAVQAIHGYARADVQRLRATAPDGSAVEVHLTKPWRPPLAGAKPIRIFLTVRHIDVGDDGLQPDEMPLVMPEPTLQATLADGRVVAIPGRDLSPRRGPTSRAP